ncbi:MAG: hypothetical protein J6Z14_05595 [Prevotella sp.]|nr:hypothetical protein [Prevotella sp.]
MAAPGVHAQGDFVDALDSISSNIGVELFEEEIDDVIFQTNEFLTDATFTGDNGPFWWILQMSMCLGALFAIIMAAGMAYKMMVKGETFDPLKIVRVLGIALVMTLWYGDFSVLDGLAYIPNCIGSYTHDLYEAEAAQVQDKYEQLLPLIVQRDSLTRKAQGEINAAANSVSGNGVQESVSEGMGLDAATNSTAEAEKAKTMTLYAGLMVFLDKIIMFLALIAFRIGWWGTIYCQQILLGMLTIFGPIQWAFSLLPKWEGAWAKWITRYLTVHFYGAMLYFVGFYVLLLFDIVLSVQYENLTAILESQQTFNGYLQNTIMTAGYLLVASIVALKCLNLVPDLAAWMIPEGDTAFSTRNFGEGVASQAKASATSIIR